MTSYSVQIGGETTVYNDAREAHSNWSRASRQGLPCILFVGDAPVRCSGVTVRIDQEAANEFEHALDNPELPQ
jgi:hypothetical protein